MKQNILVTGASSGFGLLVATELHKRGHHVIGTSRNPEKYASKLPFKLISLNLDSAESINSLAQSVFSEVKKLDVLINNAGFLVSGIAEETPIELGRQQLETNFWGTIKVTNALLPQFRRQKSGKIITVGSIVGLVSFPNGAYYAASKHALEGYFKSLRYELKEFNINVAMIQPAAFKTNILDNSSTAVLKIDDYDLLRRKIEGFTNNLVAQAGDPAIVAGKVIKVVETDNPKFRNIVGKGTSALIHLQHFAYGFLEKNVLKQLNS
ncbi:MAG TPA: SDR family oxidoreductase [Chitinophagaceae bacterium]|mgnify:CR=1 FL=1|nr:SDR family oxidoreductase [Chitinophagaceae bacterium]HPH30486.1 SDR family oxidoreductase [Chitinophagaceae bacterium]HPN57669.1 SDR family oxidoreductase [Chitinophagaceae bacterium]